MDWRVWIGTTVVVIGLTGMVACGDEEDEQEECSFCVEEGAPDSDLEQRIVDVCEDGCEMEAECFGTPPGGGSVSDCIDMCLEDVERELNTEDEECLEAEVEAAECFVSLSCDEVQQGGFQCEHKWVEADEICGYGGGPRGP